MRPFILSCCTTADLAAEHYEKRDLKPVCFHYFLDEVGYADDMGKSISYEDFYAAMQNGASTRTAQVNVEEYIAHFTPYLEQGYDILHVTLSTGLSGTYNSASIAQADLQKRFPEAKIYILDSLAASGGFGLLMDRLADLRDEGKSIDEVYEWGLANRNYLHHWFFSTDLTFYVKGGRISKVAGWFGTMLKICPLLHVDEAGKLIPMEKIRTKKKVIEAIVDKMKAHAQDGLAYADKCYITHSACYEDARAVADLIEAAFPNLKEKVSITYVGTTIGSHTGPGTVALFFWGDSKNENGK